MGPPENTEQSRVTALNAHLPLRAEQEHLQQRGAGSTPAPHTYTDTHTSTHTHTHTHTRSLTHTYTQTRAPLPPPPPSHAHTHTQAARRTCSSAALAVRSWMRVPAIDEAISSHPLLCPTSMQHEWRVSSTISSSRSCTHGFGRCGGLWCEHWCLACIFGMEHRWRVTPTTVFRRWTAYAAVQGGEWM